MVLKQLSANNTFFLFEDLKRKVYVIYQIECNESRLTNQRKFGKIKSQKEEEQTGTLRRESLFWFKPVYEFDPTSLKMFSDYGSSKEQILDQMDQIVNQIIGDDGTVTLSCSKHEVEGTLIQVHGCIISFKDRALDVKTFKHIILFDKEAKADINRIISQKETQIQKQLDAEIINQKYLPKNLKNPSLKK